MLVKKGETLVEIKDNDGAIVMVSHAGFVWTPSMGRPPGAGGHFLGAIEMLAKEALRQRRNQESAPVEQHQLPGDPSLPVWEGEVAVDVSLGAPIRVHAADEDRAAHLMREHASTIYPSQFELLDSGDVRFYLSEAPTREEEVRPRSRMTG